MILWEKLLTLLQNVFFIPREPVCFAVLMVAIVTHNNWNEYQRNQNDNMDCQNSTPIHA